MKQTFLIASFLIFMSAATHAQTNMQNGGAEQQVTKVLNQMADAFLKSDTSVLKKCFADTYIFSDPGGNMHNKKYMIDFMEGGKFKIESVIPSDRKISVYENTAVLTEQTKEKGHVGNDDISGEYRWTFIFYKQDNEWKIVAEQGTRMLNSKTEIK